METLKLTNNTIQIKSELKDLTISQFENLMFYANKKKYDSELDSKIECYSVLTDLSVDDIESLEFDDFNKLIEAINFDGFQNVIEEITPEITIEGVIYKAKVKEDGSYGFTVKEIKLINNLIISNPDFFIVDLLAIVYRPETNPTDLSEDGLKARKVLFKDLSIELASPFLIQLTKANLNGK